MGDRTSVREDFRGPEQGRPRLLRALKLRSSIWKGMRYLTVIQRSWWRDVTSGMPWGGIVRFAKGGFGSKEKKNLSFVTVKFEKVEFKSFFFNFRQIDRQIEREVDGRMEAGLEER